MVRQSTFLLAAAALLAASLSDAAPSVASRRDVPREGASQPITRRGGAAPAHPEHMHAWANAQRVHLRRKYALDGDDDAAAQSSRRDDAGAATLANVQYDSSWTATFSVGSNAQQVPLVLDTGSADIWIASGAKSPYSPSESTSFSNTSTAFDITYGSGAVDGYLVSDTMSVAGKTASSQTFALATEVTAGLLNNEISGIAGLGFQSLSTGNTAPLWSNVGLTSGSEEFAFFLKRQEESSGPTSDEAQYGGVFTLGGANTTLYQGSINWSEVINKAYWLITLGGVSVDGTALDIGSTVKAAIDTGTTLIGGPTSVISALYAQIPNSQASSSSQGYYEFPCDTSVNATITFGDQQYTINAQDFVAGATNRAGTTCMGAFFDVGSDANTRSLQWIVGDAFLKGVYSVFQNGSPARVGFASLADGLNSGTSSTTVSQTKAATSGAAAAFGRAYPAVGLAALVTSALLLA